MSNLFEINRAILDCLDMETGEIVDVEALDALMLEREEKMENIALWIKNLLSDAAAYKAEKESFADREKKATAKAESLKRYLTAALDGQKFKTTRCEVGFSRSVKTEVFDLEKVPREFVTEEVTYKPDKTAIKEAIKAGQEIEGCRLVENLNIRIK